MVKYVYLVDCENVGNSNLVPDNPEESLVYYFIGNLNKQITSKKSYEFYIQRSHTGCKDALDFILDSYLGFCLNKYGRDVTYYIVSNDLGFENMTEFWGSYGYNIQLYKTRDPNTVNNELVEYIQKLFKNKPKYIRKVINIYKCNWKPKQGWHSLYTQLSRSVSGVISKKQIETLCDFIWDKYT